MDQSRCRRGLGIKTPLPIGVALNVNGQQLKCNGPVQFRIDGFIDFADVTLPDPPYDLVLPQSGEWQRAAFWCCHRDGFRKGLMISATYSRNFCPRVSVDAQ